MTEDNTVVIVEDETIEIAVARQGITLARYTYFFALGCLAIVGLVALAVLIYSASSTGNAPNWAVATVSSIVTGSLAVIFKDHVPAMRPRTRAGR